MLAPAPHLASPRSPETARLEFLSTEGMLREAFEELRYDAGGVQFGFMLPHFNERRGATMERHYFACLYDSSQSLELHEGQAMAWYSLDSLQELDLTTQVTAAMDRIQSLVTGVLRDSSLGAHIPKP